MSWGCEPDSIAFEMKTLRIIPFVLLTAAMPAVARAQTFIAGKIQFSNPGPYSQAQLEAAAGMHAGSKFTAEELGAAAQRLADTGYFSDVGAKTAPGRVDAITVVFDVKPISQDQMLHVVFENLVWLTHDEIEAALEAKAPLFMDYVPGDSPLLDIFNDALTEALAKKGVTAKVSHDTYEPTLERPEIDIAYRVVDPAPRVINMKLAGVPTELAPLIQKSMNSVGGRAYNGGLEGDTTEERILAPLKDAGYIDATLTDESLAAGSQGQEATVVLSATLHAGDVYRVSNIAFAGCPMLSADEFAATAKLHDGDIAGRAQLLETLKPLDTAYRRQGYADVAVKATPREDATTHQVAYTVTVLPGEQYHVKTVTTNGLDAAAQADFDRAFLMKTGDIYNPEYIQTFFKQNTALQATASQALAGYGFTYKAYADPATHTVDLVLTFVRGMVERNR